MRAVATAQTLCDTSHGSGGDRSDILRLGVLLKMVRFVIFEIDDAGMRYSSVACPCTNWAQVRSYVRELCRQHPNWKIWLVGVCI